ncbi:MAG: YdcF family protein [Acidobacteriota bacterium]
MLRQGARVCLRLVALLGALLLLVTLLPPRWYVNWLSGAWNPPRGATLIVLGADSLDGQLLGAGSYWRSVAAVLAWRQGEFEHLILSGNLDATAPMRDFITAQGIPASAIVIEGRSRSTRENALFTTLLARQFPGPYVLLTSDYHMWRAHHAFQKAGLTVLPSPFSDALKRMNQWSDRWPIFVELVVESVKIAYYRARGWV